MASMAQLTIVDHGTFPPFPAPPRGATIVPFSTFVPMGYRRITNASGDVIEVDAWGGVPTVKVLNEEEAKQRRKGTKKRKNAGNTMDAEGRLIPWWEEWETDELSRRMSQGSFDSHTSLESRVCMAADDFRLGRSWPEIAHGVRLLWDQFRLYIGLISSIPVYKRIKRHQGQIDGPGNAEEESDEEEDAPKARQTTIAVQDNLEQGALPGKQLEPRLDQSAAETERLRNFLNDMEKTIKVFLSSYMSTTGLIWAEKNLFIAPTVLHFFLRFMLRNRVFADSQNHLASLVRALSYAAIAQKELPLTAKIGQILPGKFDHACREYWGTQGDLTIQVSADISPTSTNGAGQSDTSSAFETELRKEDVEVLSSNAVLDSGLAKQVLEEGLTTDSTVSLEGYTTESWTDVPVPSLMEILGPTTFPLTMMTGVIESSTRRVREIMMPRMNLKSMKNMSPVEETLTEIFFKVVLSPWMSASEDLADFPRPVIAPNSKGAVVAEALPEGMDAGKVEIEPGEEPWNPYRDEVTILVEADVARQLVAGMGLSGTWVQMVPEGDGKHPRACFWYTECLTASLPSYYTEGEMNGEMPEDDEED